MAILAHQQTLARAVAVHGIGVHSGAPATLTLNPAPANTGIVFIRTDITDRDNVIPASWDLVADTRLCTVLANKAGASVSTVEHVMSACAALQLDNAIIHVDGPEIPIMDGSARDFVAAIDDAGVKKQDAARKVIRIKKTVTYTEGDKLASFSPALEPQYDFDISFDSAVIGRQTFAHRLTEAGFRTDIADCRTFGFLHEVEQLRKMGLARGGSLDNAVVIDGEKVMNPNGLRYPDEFVRHKILDAVGDIALAGLQVIGHYHGIKAGHAMNNKLLRALFADETAFEVVTLAAPRKNSARAQAAQELVLA
jgi:UDP-3-O-[3-hydroxymyristoyl] N-acetylglucosamine deacetylase